MDERLLVQLALKPNCQLEAIDHSPYETWTTDLVNHVVLEFIVYNKEEAPKEDSIVIMPIKTHKDYFYLRRSAPIQLSRDGNWHYYKLIVPCLEHLLDDASGLYNVDEETFYYNGEFYIGPENNTGIPKLYTIEEAVAASTKSRDYLAIYKYNGSQTFIFQQNVFSVCKLNRCLVNLQRQLINDLTKSCKFKSCAVQQELKLKCDLLLSAVSVLEYLIDSKNFTEAQRIIDNLSTCNSICGDDVDDFDTNSCGCGNSI